MTSRPVPEPRLPDVVPVLARGRHRTPRGGACFMEMASYLAGERWSDHPACTHPLLAALAREVNDHTSDVGRPRLGRLVPAVIGLVDDDPATDVRIALACARAALPVVAEERQRALAVAALTGEHVLALLQGAPRARVSPRTREALAQVPLAAAWATRFLGDVPPSTRGYRRHSAPHVVSASVRGIAHAYGVDPDAMLHDLLAEAITAVAPRAAVTPVDPAAWDAACRLSAAGRRQPAAG